MELDLGDCNVAAGFFCGTSSKRMEFMLPFICRSFCCIGSGDRILSFPKIRNGGIGAVFPIFFENGGSFQTGDSGDRRLAAFGGGGSADLGNRISLGGEYGCLYPDSIFADGIF